MENKVNEICKEYGFVSGCIKDYKGGYPVLSFIYVSEDIGITINKREMKKIIRKSEIDAGIELGVGLNFINTAGIQITDDHIIVYGHISVIEKMLKNMFRKE